MISSVIYLFAFIMGTIGDFFDFLLPFDVPAPILSVVDIINSFWYYGLQFVPLTTIIIAKFFFFAFTFYIVFKIVGLVRLPFTWLENHLGGTPSAPSAPARPSRSSFGDVRPPFSSRKK